MRERAARRQWVGRGRKKEAQSAGRSRTYRNRGHVTVTDRRGRDDDKVEAVGELLEQGVRVVILLEAGRAQSVAAQHRWSARDEYARHGRKK